MSDKGPGQGQGRGQSRRPRVDAERNRARLLDAAREAFASGREPVTLEQIARDSGVGVEDGLHGGGELLAGLGHGHRARGEDRAERVGHLPLGGDVAGEPVHPRPQGALGGVRREQAVDARAQFGELLAVQRLDQCLAGGEMPVEGADADAGVPRDLLKRHGLPAGRERRPGRVKQARSVPLRVYPRASGLAPTLALALTLS